MPEHARPYVYTDEATPLVPGHDCAATAEHVLDAHAALHDHLARPNPGVLLFFRQFAEIAEREAASTGPDWGFGKQLLYPFYDPDRPEGDPGWPGKLAGAIARGLFTATTYQVTAAMCEVAEATYAATAARAVTFEASDLPGDTGFLWLDKPFRRTDDGGAITSGRAVTWTPQAMRISGASYPGTRLCVWTDYAAEDSAGYSPRSLDLLRSLGPLVMSMTVVIPFGRYGAVAASSGDTSPLHYVHALWLLLGTEIAAASRPPVGRGARRRAARSIKQNEVTVVTLRRARGPGGDGEAGHRDVDWSCRWLVRGFWRHLEDYADTAPRHEARGDGSGFCTACAARVTWVRPHVRGPEDRPLRATRTVYRLSR